MPLLLRANPNATSVPGQPEPTLQVPILDARIAWRPEQFDTVTNPDFETDTTGWSIASSGLSAGGISVTRVTTDPYAGSANGQVVTDAVADSGVRFAWGSGTFHRLPVVVTLALRHISGGRRAKVIIGSNTDSTDRAKLIIDELPDEWTTYSLRWLPASTYGDDVRLAIVTNDARAMTFDLDEVHVHNDTLTQLDWTTASTTGWTVDGSGDSAAATSLTSMTSGGFPGRYLQLVTTSTDESGADYDLGTRKFTAGREYRLRVALRNISGSTSTRLRIGGTVGDETDTDVTTTTSWAWYTADWTPASDRATVAVSIGNGAAASQTVGVGSVDVFEKLDEVTLEELRTGRGIRFDRSTPGTIRAVVLDPDETYSPRNTSSALSPDVRIGRRMHVRATFEGKLYGLAYGITTALRPDPLSKKIAIEAEDGLYELDQETIEREFSASGSYADARDAVLSTVLPDRQINTTTASLESSTFHDGTDRPVSILSYLDDLSEATGTVHHAEPRPHLAEAWRYETIDRATLTSDRGGPRIDEDFQTVSVSSPDEAFVSHQRVTWQGYEREANGVVVEATAARPYLTYDEDYGSSEQPQPEGIYQLKRVTKRKKILDKRGNVRRVIRRKRRKRKRIGTRWVDSVVPLTAPAGERRSIVVDFLMPMEDIAVAVTGTTAYTTDIEVSRVTIHVDAGATAETLTALSVTATPHRPLDEHEEVATVYTAGLRREEGEIDNEYIPSAGAAAGLAEHITWRYGTPALRPEVVVQHKHPFQLVADVGWAVRLSADRWYIDDDRYVVRYVDHEVTRGGFEWETTLGLEELPDGGDWITLDGSTAQGLDSSATLAY